MKCATLADAPAVLNTNDKAMWVLGYNAAAEAVEGQIAAACRAVGLMDIEREALLRELRATVAGTLSCEATGCDFKQDAEAMRVCKARHGSFCPAAPAAGVMASDGSQR